MLTVYLDSQDYSRIADARRLGNDRLLLDIFERLIAFRESGRVAFFVSLPILSELLQYDASRAALIREKAKVVEEICGPAALICPTRLVGLEIARSAASLGLGTLQKDDGVLNFDRYWYPNISEPLVKFQSKVEEKVSEELSHLRDGNRRQRREYEVTAKRARAFWAKKIAENAHEIVELGFPASAIQQSLGKLLSGSLDPERASIQLFGSVAKPEKFIDLYFERMEGKKDLPFWLRDLGQILYDSLDEMIRDLDKFNIDKKYNYMFSDILDEKMPEIRRLLALVGSEDMHEFLNTSVSFEDLPQEVIDRLPSVEVASRLYRRYVEQVVGVHERRAGLEKSFGGDIVHSLYLPFVELWRSDRRTSAAVSTAIPSVKEKVVPTLAALPSRIEARLALR